MGFYSSVVTEDGAYDVSQNTTVDYASTATFTAPITDLGSDLNVSGVLNLPGQSFSLATVENSGTINGSGGASMTVTGSMTWDGGTIRGFGALDIANGATLQINVNPSFPLTLDGVVLENAGAAALTLPSCCVGVLALENGAGIDNQATADFSVLNNVTVTSDATATFFTNEGSLINGSGETRIEPAFTQAASGTTSVQAGSMSFYGVGAFSGSITGVAGTTVNFLDSPYSFSANSSLSTAGSVGFYSSVVTEDGAYDVSQSTTVDYASTATFTAPITDLGSDLNVSGVLNLPGQSFSLATVENSGTINNGGGGASMTGITGSMTWDGGTIRGFRAAFGHCQRGNASDQRQPFFPLTLDGVVLENAGTAALTLANCCGGVLALENGAGINNSVTGSFAVQGGDGVARITSDGTATFFENEGSLTAASFDSAFANTIEPAFTQTASGTVDVQQGTLGLNNAMNAGIVTVSSGTSLGVGSYTQTAGSTVLIGGTINGGFLNIGGGSLSGTGTINANVTSGGQIIPGGVGTAGTLTINGNYSQTSTGAFDIGIGGTAAGTQYDQLAVSGAATLGGAINVSIFDGFAPALGNTFQPLTFASYSGNFGFYNGIVLGNRLLLDPTLYPTNLTLTVQPAVTTTTLAALPSPSVSGQSVTFTAAVTVALPPTTIDQVPTGTVTFYNNGTSIGTETLSVVNGQDQARLTIATLSTASHSITATYTSGDSNFIPSPTSSSVTQVVNEANTSASVASSGTPTVHGQSVVFTATVSVVSPGSTVVAYPTGTVTFYDGGTSIGTGTLSVVSGQDQATLTTNALGTATHSITAAYTSGDGNFNASLASRAISQEVNKDNTTTTAGASPSSANLGQTVAVTATVMANTPGSGTPTGTVDFYDTTTSTDLTPGGVALSSGTVAFSTTSLQAGPHTIKATYSGDANFVTSYGTAGTVTVGQSIIVLDPSAGGALSISGNASINLPGGVFVDSSASTALSASGNAQIKATVIDVHGGVQKSANASLSPAPVTGAAVDADPYASVAEPSTTGLTNYGSVNFSTGSHTINPGIYTNISVSGNANLTMSPGSGGSPGIYIIEGGGFSVSGNANVTGSGVTIFNAGSKYAATGGTYGSISLSGNGSYNLTPPTSGIYAGIVLFQSRDNAKALTVSGNASGMTGMIYAPAAQLSASGNAALNASIDVDTLSISGNGVANTVTLSSPAGTVAYTPNQIRDAYGVSNLTLDGTGQTIAIVDAYDDPSIFQALDAFDIQFGLTPSGPTLYRQYGPASSFLTVLNQRGQATSLPGTDPNGPGTDNWEVEEALDVEWAHAIAPGAQIILVEADSQSLPDLMASVATAASQPGVSVVSMSWGFAEGQAVLASDEATYDAVFTTPGVTYVASTGDYGAADPEYPAYSPNVVAVGGTSLTLNGDGSYNSETGWGYQSAAAGAFIGSGGGISLYETEPAFQRGVQSTGYRTTPDVSLVADPATGAWIADPYNLDPSNPFEVVGGTSLSAPAWAGLVALVNQGRAAAGESALNSSTPTDTQQALYSLPQSDFNVITGGTNGYSAGSGYNLVTGLGTPVANLLVSDLVAYRGSGTIYSGPTVAPLQNAGLVNMGSDDGSLMNVFSVFDDLNVRGGGDVGARDPGPGWAFNSPVAKSHASGEAIHVDIPGSPVTDIGGGMMSLDNTALVDGILMGWSRAGAPPARRLPVRGGAAASPSMSRAAWLNLSDSRMPVLDTGSVDALLGNAGMPHSFLDINGNRMTIKRML